MFKTIEEEKAAAAKTKLLLQTRNLMGPNALRVLYNYTLGFFYGSAQYEEVAEVPIDLG